MHRTLPALPLLTALLAAPAPPAAAADPVTLTGALHPADGGSPAGVRVVALAGGAADSVEVGDDGSFTLQLEAPAAAHARLLLRPGPRDDYHPATRVVRIGRGDTLRLVLIPRRWVIRTGTHAGDTVDIDPRAATAPSCRGCNSFWRREEGDTVPGRTRGIPGWAESSLPLRVAFDHELGAPITAGDSAAFMRVARALERDLGRRWFVPAQTRDVWEAPDGDPFGSILVSIDPELRDAGRGNWVTQGGEVLAGVVFLNSARLIHQPGGPQIVAHELMHTLGFGHTCSWRSVLADRHCPGRRAPAPTPEDVAHAQLLMRIRTLERKFGIWGTVEAATSYQLPASSDGS